MQKIFFVLLLFVLTGCASNEVKKIHSSKLEVIELSPNKWTAMTKQNILHLSQVYDLSPFLYSRKVQIQSKVVPHSHPVITLNTRNAEHPNKVLSTLLHEEFHWWMTFHKSNAEKAMSELKSIYPDAPKNEGTSEGSTYWHLVICYLEFKALTFYLGEDQARSIIQDFIEKAKLYPWTYTQILADPEQIEEVVKKYDLLPTPL